MNEAKSAAMDPVCGRTVDPSTALYAELYGKSLYFCSEPCRQRFCPGPPVPGRYNHHPELATAADDDGDRRQG